MPATSLRGCSFGRTAVRESRSLATTWRPDTSRSLSSRQASGRAAAWYPAVSGRSWDALSRQASTTPISLSATEPRDGGDYEYLNRAFGTWCGFLFSWAQLVTVISGNIAIMAYAFADYAARLWPALSAAAVVLAISAVVALSALNALGIVAGK